MNWYDWLMLLGLALIVAGVAFIYWPAALIVAGVAAVVFSLLAARVDAEKLPPK